MAVASSPLLAFSINNITSSDPLHRSIQIKYTNTQSSTTVMGWPCSNDGGMEFSAPTSASHPTEAQDERNTKRRKVVEHGSSSSSSDSNMMMMEPPGAVSTSSSSSSSSSGDESTGMAVECQSNTGSSSNSAASSSATSATAASSNHNKSCHHHYAHPASSNLFNGNALSDEELVYQVDYLSSCPPGDFVM